MQYRFFKEQAEKMLLLQQDYQNYIVSFKKSLTESGIQEQENLISVEKKKPINEQQINSDSEESFEDTDDVRDSFLIVNREYNYLKDSAIEFSKKHNLQYAVKHMYDLYDWNEDGEFRFIANDRNIKKIIKSTSKKAKTSQDFYFHKDNFQFQWPMDKATFRVGSKYGPRKKTNGVWGFHYGIDLPAPKGTPVKAAAAGVIIETSYSPNGYGKSIVIAHNKKYRTRYAHLDTIYVKIGQKVETNEYIGRVGATGFVVGKKPFHLHFEVIVFGKKIDPLYVLN